MQVKLGLIHFLRSHAVEVCERTQVDIKFDKMGMILTPEVGIWLNVKKWT